MRNLLIAGVLALAVLSGPAAGDEAVPTLNDPVVAKREVELAKQLRCLVCQNETIADSRAGLAVDLRNDSFLGGTHGRGPGHRRGAQQDKGAGDARQYRSRRHGSHCTGADEITVRHGRDQCGRNGGTPMNR